MSRNVRRVPLDFDVPLNKTWKGFINPYFLECPKCMSGYSDAYNYIRYKSVYKVLEDRVKHIKIPTEQEETVRAIISRLIELGDKIPSCSVDTSYLIRDLGIEYGLGDDWFTCKYCNGYNVHPEVLHEYNSWKSTPPPEGEAYQLWMDNEVPITPPSKTLEELAEYCEKEKVSIFAHDTLTKEQWLEKFKEDIITYQIGNIIII